MKTNRLIGSLMMLTALALPLHADDFSNNFSVIDQDSLDALAKDFGAAMGSGSFHNGKALGFPLGFDVGAHVTSVGVKNEDSILKDDGSSLLAQWVQAEVGLPLRLNVIGRVGKIEDANTYGGGLRMGILSPSVPGLPALSVTALYNVATHDMFDATTLSANAVLSIDIPFIHPYLGVGYDRTKLEVNDDPSIPLSKRTLDSTADGYRAEAGINLSLIPFTYINLGVGLANGEGMYHGGLGVKF